MIPLCANYSDLTGMMVNVQGNHPNWPNFRLVNYYDLPRSIYSWVCKRTNVGGWHPTQKLVSVCAGYTLPRYTPSVGHLWISRRDFQGKTPMAMIYLPLPGTPHHSREVKKTGKIWQSMKCAGKPHIYIFIYICKSSFSLTRVRLEGAIRCFLHRPIFNSLEHSSHHRPQPQ